MLKFGEKAISSVAGDRGTGTSGCSYEVHSRAAADSDGRAVNSPERPHCYEFGRFRVYPSQRTVKDSQGGVVPLRPKALDALLCFIERPGEIIDRATLLDTLWPNLVVEENNLTQTITALRRAIGDTWIVTIPRRGYQFVGPVRVVSEDAHRDGRSDPSQRSRHAASRLPYRRVAKMAGIALVITAAALSSGLFLLYDFERPDAADLADAQARVATATGQPSTESRATLPSGPLNVSPQAHVLYQRALEAIASESYASESVLTLLDKAIELEPEFAPAYLIRAASRFIRAHYISMGMPLGPERNLLGDVSREIELLRADALEALKHDAQLGYAHALLGAVARFNGDPASAQKHFEQARTVSLNDPKTLLFIAAYDLLDGRRTDAIELIERALPLTPPNPDTPQLLVAAGEIAMAEGMLRDLAATHATEPRLRLALGFMAAVLGKPELAESELRLAEELFTDSELTGLRALSFPADLVYFYGRIGRQEDARRIFDDELAPLLDALPPEAEPGSAAFRVHAHLGIGDIPGALHWAEIMAQRPLPLFLSPQWYFVLNSADDPILEEPEFIELRRELAAGTGLSP